MRVRARKSGLSPSAHDRCAPLGRRAGMNFPATARRRSQRGARPLEVAVFRPVYCGFVLRHVGGAARDLGTFE